MGACDHEKAYTSRGYRVAAACEETLEKIGVDLERCLGCGAYGCVFEVDEGVVAKVLAADGEHGLGEANVARLLESMGARAHPALPQVFGVHRLTDCLKDQITSRPGMSIIERAYVVIREDVPDREYDDKDLAHAALSYIEDYYNSTNPKSRDPAIEIQRDFIAPNRDDWSKRDYHAILAALSLHSWGFKHGLQFWDTHPDNWGQRDDGAVVLRDLGASGGPWDEDTAPKGVPVLGDLHRRNEPLILRGLRGWAD